MITLELGGNARPEVLEKFEAMVKEAAKQDGFYRGQEALANIMIKGLQETGGAEWRLGTLRMPNGETRELWIRLGRTVA